MAEFILGHSKCGIYTPAIALAVGFRIILRHLYSGIYTPAIAIAVGCWSINGSIITVTKV